MSKLGVLIWRHIFESGDEKRLKTQLQDLSDLHIVRDIPYADDQERGHLFDIYELPELPGIRCIRRAGKYFQRWTHISRKRCDGKEVFCLAGKKVVKALQKSI